MIELERRIKSIMEKRKLFIDSGVKEESSLYYLTGVYYKVKMKEEMKETDYKLAKKIMEDE